MSHAIAELVGLMRAMRSFWKGMVEEREMAKVEKPYRGASRQLKKRLRLYWWMDTGLILLGLACYMGPLVLSLFGIQHKSLILPVIVGLPIAFSSIVTRTIAGFYLNAFLCPRCQQPFLTINPHLRNPTYAIDRARRRDKVLKCQHCGLNL